MPRTVAVVGAGPAGMTAAMYAGRSMLKSVILEAGEPGGELLKTEVIEDYPGFEHVLGRDLAEKFAAHAKKFGCEFREFTKVSSVRQRSGSRGWPASSQRQRNCTAS